MQTINRNNYEEFFLLYTDGELGTAQQYEVENFVQQNPDLAVELEMLLNTRLHAEKIEFDNKENLLRTEGESINETNYEEYFLLYIDNELSKAKREEVEMYVLKHPNLQDEFTVLKQAVLTPELIGYGAKDDLYRTRKRRAIYIKPWRFAAAAIFIGLCAVGLWMMEKQNNSTTEIAIDKPSQKAPEKLQPLQNNKVEIATATDSVGRQTQQPTVAEQSNPVKESKASAETAIVKKRANARVQNAETGIAKNESAEPVIKHDVIAYNNIVKQQKEPPAEANDIVAELPDSFDQKQNDVALLQTPMNNDAQQNYKTYNVAYKEINTDDEDHSLLIGSLDLNKDKVKNLFKKAGRMFGKSNSANEDGKLQVANFEIDTKKQ